MWDFNLGQQEEAESEEKKPEARHNLPLSSTATKLLLQLQNVCCDKSFEECNYCTQCNDRIITTIFFHTQLSVMQKW